MARLGWCHGTIPLRVPGVTYAGGFYERHGYQRVDTATVEKRGVPVTVGEMERLL